MRLLAARATIHGMAFVLKTLLSAAIIAAATELGKRSTTAASLLAAFPLTTILVVSWLYWDTGDTEKVAKLSTGIFWAILPSLVFMLTLPWLLRRGWGFGLAMAGAAALMGTGYTVYVWVFGRLGFAS